MSQELFDPKEHKTLSELTKEELSAFNKLRNKFLFRNFLTGLNCAGLIIFSSFGLFLLNETLLNSMFFTMILIIIANMYFLTMMSAATKAHYEKLIEDVKKITKK